MQKYKSAELFLTKIVLRKPTNSDYLKTIKYIIYPPKKKNKRNWSANFSTHESFTNVHRTSAGNSTVPVIGKIIPYIHLLTVVWIQSISSYVNQPVSQPGNQFFS